MNGESLHTESLRILTSFLGKRVQLAGPMARFRYGGGGWHLYNNSLGTVSSTLDGHSLDDDRLQVLFDGPDGMSATLDTPIAHLRVVEPQSLPTPATTQPHNTTVPDSNFFFLTFVTAQYHHWFCHLVRNLVLLRFSPSSLCICTPDEETRHLAARWGAKLAPRSLSDGVGGGGGLTAAPGKSRLGHTFKSAAFAQMALGKQRCLWGMLKRVPPGAAYLFLDADVTLLQNPFAWLAHHQRMPGVASGGFEFDVAIQDDNNGVQLFPEANIGLLLLVNTAATRAFGDAFLAELCALLPT